MPKPILLDLKMPEVDGLEVLRKLKNDPDRKIIPVVVFTSSKEERDIVEPYKLSVNAYIVKPVDFSSQRQFQIWVFFWLVIESKTKLRGLL